MNNKVLAILAIVVVAGLGIYLYNQKEAKAPDNGNMTNQSQSAGQEQNLADSTPTPTPTPTPTNKTTESQGTFSAGADAELGVDVAVFEVAYDSQTFSPQSTDIKLGDVVIFRNKSSADFWPASAPHPAHTDYPEFDAKKPIAPGGKFEFKFEKLGNWKFHDHLNPSAHGVINVTAK